MNIVVARCAFRRRALEVDALYPCLRIRRPMALAADEASMSAFQRKPRLRVVEGRYLQPRVRGVARRATLHRAIRALGGHHFCKLPFVRIVVTRRAASIFKSVLRRSCECAGLHHRVATDAWHRQMRTRQRKPRRIVLRQRELRRLEPCHRVAVFAAIFMAWPGELPFVNVGVARRAPHILNREDCFGSLRNVALGASDAGMFSFEWITRFRVLLHVECRRAKAFDRMAGRTIAPESAAGKLTPVRIGRVAVDAFLEADGGVEVTRLVAALARHRFVSSEKRKGRLGMVESLRQLHLFPRSCVVAGLAGILERPVMGIGVAIRALPESDSDILHVGFWARHRDVAFFAGDVGVRAGQSKFRCRVIEFCGWLPACFSVAVRAGLPQLAVVLVCVAGAAVARKPKKSAIQIFNDNGAPLIRRNILRIVALLAGQPGMFPRQRVAGF